MLLGAAVGALFMAVPASAADLDLQGDWNVTGTQSFADISIEVHATSASNWTDGNITIQPGGSLTLTRCTLIMPWNKTFYVGGTLVLDNTTVDGAAWFFWMNGTTTLTNTHIVNATYSLNSTYKEVWVASASTTFDRVTWTDANGNGSVIRMQVPLDFQGQTLTGGVGVRYSVNPAFANAAVDVSQNRFYDYSLNARYGIAVDGDAIPQPLHFEIHHNTFNGTAVGVGLLRVDDNTTYEVHDIAFNSTSFGVGIMPGVQGSGIRFKGHLNITDYTVLNAYVGVWMWGAAPYDMVVNIQRMTAVNVSYVLSIGGGFAEVRDSTFIATRTWIYEGLSQGHIRVYETADTAFFATLPGTNATVEHLVWLPLTGATWQGGVPMQGQIVSLANGTGVVNLTVDPQTWTAQYVVAWGVYPGGLRVDNRDLSPVVVSEGVTFPCTPSQFFVADGSPSFGIVCTDDRAPSLTVSYPLSGSYLNRSTFILAGNMTEAGSGLATFEYSLDNVSFVPVAPGANGSAAWTAAVGPLADGAYTLTVRATDRTGNVRYATVFPVRIDTAVPTLVMSSFPPWTSSTSWMINGSSEPFAQVTVRRAYGWNQTVTMGADGKFSITVPLDEGVNTYSVHVVDLAGNAADGEAVIRVDTIAPQVSALLDEQPVAALWTANATIEVAGTCEPGATVVVGTADVTRSSSSYLAIVALQAGRNDIEVDCTDPAGNTGRWFGFVFLDDSPPSLVVSVDGAVEISPGRFLIVSSLAALTGTVTDAGSGLDVVSVNGSPVAVSGAGDLTVSVEAAEGETQVQVMAVDRVGNTATATLTVVRDSVAPTATITFVSSGTPIVDIAGTPTTRATQVTLQITLSEDSHVSYGSTDLDLPAGQTLQPLALSAGANRLTVSVTDLAGNRAPDIVLQIVQDGVPPEVTIYTPAPGAVVNVPSVEVTGSAEPGGSVTVAGKSVVLSATGEFHVFVDLVEGSNMVLVHAEDALGNGANATVSVEYRLPEEPPVQAPAGGMELPMLLIGVAAGAVLGAVAMGMRRAGSRKGEEDETVHARHGPVPPEEQAAPDDAPAARGPKGPRGPAPPP